MKCLIVAGGNTDYDFTTDLVKKSGFEMIIAADRGMEYMYAAKIMPDVIVGDFDSVNREALEFFQTKEFIDLHMLNPEKDDTDTEYAIRFAIKKGADHIMILGGTGSRIDHVIGNLSLLGIGLESNVRIELVDPNNRIRMINSDLVIDKSRQFGKYVSIFPVFDKDNLISLEGFKYPLDKYTFKGYSTIGVSNEIVAERGIIRVHKGTFLVAESID